MYPSHQRESVSSDETVLEVLQFPVSSDQSLSKEKHCTGQTPASLRPKGAVSVGSSDHISL